MSRGTRADHLAWCKERAIQYVEIGNLQEAYASFTSDMQKHDETANHPAMMMGMQMFFAGLLNTESEMRKFIEGFN